MPILLSLRLDRILGLFLIILNQGCAGFPPSQMYPASSELADGSRVGPGKVDSFSLVSSEDLIQILWVGGSVVTWWGTKL